MNKTQYIFILTIFMIFFIILPITISQETISTELIDEHKKSIINSDVTFTYSIVYIGTISNLQKTDKEIEFDSIRLLRYTHISTSDNTFWSYSLAHYENTHHYHEGYETTGLITNNLIFAKLTKEI